MPFVAGPDSSVAAVTSVCRLRQIGQPLRDDPVAVLGGVLVAHGRSCRRMSESGHQFGQGGTGRGGENRAGVPKVVEPEVGAGRPRDPQPGSTPGTASRRCQVGLAVCGWEQQTVAAVDVRGQVVLQISGIRWGGMSRPGSGVGLGRPTMTSPLARTTPRRTWMTALVDVDVAAP